MARGGGFFDFLFGKKEEPTNSSVAQPVSTNASVVSAATPTTMPMMGGRKQRKSRKSRKVKSKSRKTYGKSRKQTRRH